MASSKNGWEGPFVPVEEHLTYPESEDPTVFIDPRGNFHMLTNVNTCHKRCAQGVECGGHAWSKDGRAWTNLTIGVRVCPLVSEDATSDLALLFG
jgi:hypothetical protein